MEAEPEAFDAGAGVNAAIRSGVTKWMEPANDRVPARKVATGKRKPPAPPPVDQSRRRAPESNVAGRATGRSPLDKAECRR